MKDCNCPGCGNTFPFKNCLFFDPKKMKIFGIVYMIECQKCGEICITEPRISEKVTPKQFKQFETIIKKLKGGKK